MARVENHEASDAVISLIAEANDVDPVELTPLYDAIDPDALDALFQQAHADSIRSGSVRFTYCGYDVVVFWADGEPCVTVFDDADPVRNEDRQSG